MLAPPSGRLSRLRGLWACFSWRFLALGRGLRESLSLFLATKEVRRQHHREKELARASCISPSTWPPWSCTQPRSLVSLP